MTERKKGPVAWPTKPGEEVKPIVPSRQGATDTEPSLVERGFDFVWEGAKQAVQTVRPYGRAVTAALLIRLFQRGFLDVDEEKGQIMMGEEDLSNAFEEIENLGEQKEEWYNQLMPVVGPLLERRLKIADKAWRTKPNPEMDVTDREESLAQTVTGWLLQGEAETEIRKRLEERHYKSGVQRQIEMIASTLVLFGQKKIVERVESQEENEILIFDLPPVPLLLGSFITGEDVAASFQSALLPHQGKKRGVQILLVQRGVEENFSLVIRRGTLTGRETNEFQRPQIEYDEPPNYVVLTDTQYGKHLRHLFGIKEEVEVGLIEISAGQEREDTTRVPVAFKGSVLADAELGAASIVQDNIDRLRRITKKMQEINTEVSDVENLLESADLSKILQGETLAAEQLYEELYLQAQEGLSGTPRVDVVLWRAKQIREAIEAEESDMSLFRGQGSFDDLIDGLLSSIQEVEDNRKQGQTRTVSNPDQTKTGVFKWFKDLGGRIKEARQQARQNLIEAKQLVQAKGLLIGEEDIRYRDIPVCLAKYEQVLEKIEDEKGRGSRLIPGVKHRIHDLIRRYGKEKSARLMLEAGVSEESIVESIASVSSRGHARKLLQKFK